MATDENILTMKISQSTVVLQSWLTGSAWDHWQSCDYEQIALQLYSVFIQNSDSRYVHQ